MLMACVGGVIVEKEMAVMNIGVTPRATFWTDVKLAIVSYPGWGNSQGSVGGKPATRLLPSLATYAFDH
jgi:hypothetical protein